MQKVTLFLLVLCLIYESNTTDLCHSKCSCHEKVLSCTGLTQKDIESTDFHNSITSNLESIQINGGTITELSKNWLGPCSDNSSYRLDKLKKLDLQNNDIHYINQESLHCVPNLEELILANNQWNISSKQVSIHCLFNWEDQQVCVFETVRNLKKLNLSDAFHNHVNPKVHMLSLRAIFLTISLNKLEVLALDHNGFTVFANDCRYAAVTLPSIKLLDLSYNSLSKLDFCDILRLRSIGFLDLSYNSIISFESERKAGFIYSLDDIWRSYRNTTVDFYGNKFDCDCGLAEFYHWLNNTKVHVNRVQELYCNDKQHFNRPIVSLEPSDFTCQQDSNSQSSDVTFKQDSEFQSTDVTFMQDSELQSSDVTFPASNILLHRNHKIGVSTVGIVAAIATIVFVGIMVITIFMMRRRTNGGKLELKESLMKK